MSSWAPVEAETARAIARIFATEFVDDAELLRQIGDLGPRARRHLEEIASYRPTTAEVRRIHADYMEAWRILVRALGQLDQGVRGGNQEALSMGRHGLLDWRHRIIDVAKSLRDLRDQLQIPAPRSSTTSRG